MHTHYVERAHLKVSPPSQWTTHRRKREAYSLWACLAQTHRLHNVRISTSRAHTLKDCSFTGYLHRSSLSTSATTQTEVFRFISTHCSAALFWLTGTLSELFFYNVILCICVFALWRWKTFIWWRRHLSVNPSYFWTFIMNTHTLCHFIEYGKERLTCTVWLCCLTGFIAELYLAFCIILVAVDLYWSVSVQRSSGCSTILLFSIRGRPTLE